MEDDPAIAAIREVRHRISESVAHDPARLVRYYRELQERHRERLVTGAAIQPGEETGTAGTPATGSTADP